MSRELCKLCYHVNAVGFCVPNDVWRTIVPEQLRNGIVCLSCFARLGDEKCIAWDQEIQFYPVSLVSHIVESFGKVGLAEVPKVRAKARKNFRY